MSTVFTNLGLTRINQLRGAEQPLIIDRMVLALIPGLDPTQPVDRVQQMPDAANIVYTYTIPAEYKGYVDPDQVVYSMHIGSDVGDFSFNWIGTVESSTGTVITVTTTPETPKRKTNLSTNTTGNNITRNILMQFQDAQNLTGITVTAETWQFDYTALINAHTSDSTRHMTDAERTAWNSKAAGNHGHGPADIAVDATHRFVTDTEKSTWNSKAPGSHGHGPADITVDATHQFVSDTEKSTWNSKAAGNHSHVPSNITEDTTHRFVSDTEKSTWNNKAAGIHGHGPADIAVDATHRFVSDTEKSTWNSKAAGSHGHGPADITQDTTHRFVSDTEKSTWNSKAAGSHGHGPADITQDTTHRFVTDTEKSTWNSKAAGSHVHGPADITQDTTHRFVTDTEKSTWNSKAAGSHGHAASEITVDATHRFATDAEKNAWNNSVNHASDQSEGIHGSSTTAVAYTLVKRDSSARILANAGTTPYCALILSQFASYVASSGYVKIPSYHGFALYRQLVLQWISTTSNEDAWKTVNFPVAFPNAALAIVGSGAAGYFAADTDIQFKIVDKTSFAVAGNAYGAGAVFAFAIGY